MKLFKQGNNIALISLFVAITVTACNSSSNYDFDATTVAASITPGPTFDPASGNIPTTNNLIPRSQDGTLNFPDDPDNPNPVVQALNKLDGFSTSAPITANFTVPMNPASVTLGSTVHVYEVSVAQPSGAVLAITRELSNLEILAVATGTDNKTLALIPLAPLKAKTSYLVVLTDGIKDAQDAPTKTPGAYLLAKGGSPLSGDLAALEPLRQLVNQQETVITTHDTTITKNSIILSWSFTTQSISTVLDKLATNIKATPQTITTAAVQIPDGSGGSTILTTPAGKANVHAGLLDIPYFLSKSAPLTNSWEDSIGNDNIPVATETLSIPVIMAIPNSGIKPVNGWPMVIYQHGITRVRTDLLIHIADSLAAKGIATIAIDLPLHGLTSSTISATNPFGFLKTDNELTFELDAEQDGVDPSGTHFLNLTSLLTSRDNIRQGVVDLLVLRKAIETITDIDATKVGFIAHSLGGLVGVPYLGVEDKVTPSSLITTGAGIAQLVNGSATRGPTLRTGLAANGIDDNAKLQAFLGAAQMILDSADPINYGANAASKHPIQMIEIVGDANNLSDQTIPNTVPIRPPQQQVDPEFVPFSPLAGTEPLAINMGLTATDTSVATTVRHLIRFTQGEHETLLFASRASLQPVFVEMHNQIATFQKSYGASMDITPNTGFIKAAP